jgi:hypothetical protein
MMNRSAIPIRIAGIVGVIALAWLVVIVPVGALPFVNQVTAEPSPRPTATPAPYLQLNPVQGVAGNATVVMATGGLWLPGVAVTLYWDDTSLTLATTDVRADGTFQTTFVTPTDPGHATLGIHKVLAVQGGFQAEADFELIAPSPTPTSTVTNTPMPTDTPTPITPSPTSPPTLTPTPSPTLRPVTPMVTITPFPPTRPPATKPPAPTRTNTPIPGTPTNTLTPSVTPTPSSTPGPGTPWATALPTATPVEEISDTGAGWGPIFLWGFVLAGLLVLFRLLRVRGLPRQS